MVTLVERKPGFACEWKLPALVESGPISKVCVCGVCVGGWGGGGGGGGGEEVTNQPSLRVVQVPLWPSGLGVGLWNRPPGFDPRTVRYPPPSPNTHTHNTHPIPGHTKLPTHNTFDIALLTAFVQLCKHMDALFAGCVT